MMGHGMNRETVDVDTWLLKLWQCELLMGCSILRLDLLFGVSANEVDMSDHPPHLSYHGRGHLPAFLRKLLACCWLLKFKGLPINVARGAIVHSDKGTCDIWYT